MKSVALSFGRPRDEEGGGVCEISLNVDMQGVGIGGDRWPAAMLFCEFISMRPELSKTFSGKSVIELGSGTGLGAILCDKLFGKECRQIVATDLHSHVALMQSNLVLNSVDPQVTTCCALDWTTRGFPSLGTFDVILALECVYNQELFLPLVLTMRELSHSKTLIFLGLTRLFAKPEFFLLLLKHGFNYTMIPHHAVSLPLPEEASTHAETALFVVTLQPR